MPLFKVIYREPGTENAQQTTIQGESEAIVTAELSARGYNLLLIDPIADRNHLERFSRIAHMRLRMPRFGTTYDELALLCEVFHTLYVSGIPMLKIVSMTIDETSNAWLKARLKIVLENLKVGDSLTEAVSDTRCSKAFPPLMREMIHVGEENGRLDESFAGLAKTFRSMADTRREISSAMTYPAFTLVIFIAVCTLLAIMIPNALSKFVGASGLTSIMTRLPMPIQILFHLHDNPVLLALPPIILSVIIVIWRLLALHPVTRLWRDKFNRKLPVVGRIYSQSSLLRFLEVLAANQDSGIAIDKSLQLISSISQDAVLDMHIRRLRTGIVKNGLGLADAMAQESEDIFPGLVRQMIRAGEESGYLSEMIRPVITFYRAQLHSALKRSLDLITPIMLVALGAIVGPIIMGVFKTISILNDAMTGTLT